MAVKQAVVAHDERSGSQAIYIDGQLEDHDDTIYACDIINAVGGSCVPFTLEQRNYEDVDDDWPNTLAELQERFASA